MHFFEPTGGEEKVYLSANSTVNDEDAILYPIELLNSLQPADAPSHELRLKVGASIMLLFNLNADLVNGTLLVVESLMPFVMKAKVVSGSQAGTSILLPRVTIVPSESEVLTQRCLSHLGATSFLSSCCDDYNEQQHTGDLQNFRLGDKMLGFLCFGLAFSLAAAHSHSVTILRSSFLYCLALPGLVLVSATYAIKRAAWYT